MQNFSLNFINSLLNDIVLSNAVVLTSTFCRMIGQCYVCASTGTVYYSILLLVFRPKRHI